MVAAWTRRLFRGIVLFDPPMLESPSRPGLGGRGGAKRWDSTILDNAGRILGIREGAREEAVSLL
jgi:hypothetical protein